MQAEDDAILYQMFEDWRGSAMHNPDVLDFYKAIKGDFPETIFHGTDVAHQADSIDTRFLMHLRSEGLQDSHLYATTQENIAQYRRFRREGANHGVRAYYKPLNFIREFDALIDQDIMAIHGMGHVVFSDMGGVPTMATTLRERYGDQLETFDMTHYAWVRVFEPFRTDIISIGGRDFEASYFGIDDHAFRAGDGRIIIGREYWRVENAYEYFANHPTTGDVLPFMNFIMYIEVGQVFVVDFHYDDGSVRRTYKRSSGMIWNGLPTTEEFIP
jgi:hypothetical protein